MKRYKVTLDAQERQDLHDLIAAGQAAARKLTHARILLKADAAEGGPAWPDHQIADALEVSVATVERVRQRFVEEGLDAALDRKRRERPAREVKLDGRAEARLIALACSAPPEGRAVWTMRLLADKLVELEVVDSISDETVRLALKKRDQALAEGAMVHPAGGRRRVRLRDGGRAGSLPPALRREAPLGLPRRGEQAVDRRGGRADPGRAGPAGAVRLRVYPHRDGQPVHDQRTVARLAGGEGDRASDGGGLRRGGALAGRGGARGGGASGAGDGQLEHAQAGVAVRGVPAGAGPADRREAGDPPHPEAWQLAEHGGDRAVGAVPAVPVASDRDEGGAGTRGGGVGGRAERAGRRGAVAIHYCGCSNQAPQALPNNLRLAVY